MLLLILDSLGGTELLVILVVALVIFGPRKLPQLSRSLGRSLADFKRASYEFKETWEKEAGMADELREFDIGRAMLPPEEGHANASVGQAASTAQVSSSAATPADDAISASLVQPPSIRPVPADAALARGNLAQTPSDNTGTAAPSAATTASADGQTRKQDWL